MAQTNKTLFAQIKDRSTSAQEKRGFGQSTTLRVIIIVAACLGVTIFMPGMPGNVDSEYLGRSAVGTTWSKESVVALYSFPVYKEESQLQDERTEARKKASIVFLSNPEYKQQTVTSISQKSGTSSVDVQNHLKATSELIIAELASKLYVGRIPESGLNEYSILQEPHSPLTYIPSADIKDSTALSKSIRQLFSNARSDIQQECVEITMKSVVFPFVYDVASTRRSQEDAALSVPTALEVVVKGTELAKKGVRLTPTNVGRLSSYTASHKQRSDVPFSLLAIIGATIFVAFLVLFVVLYLYVLRPVSFYRNGQLGSLLSLLVFAAAMAWTSVRYGDSLPLEYVIIIPAISMLITVLYEARTALLLTVAMAFVVGAVRGDDYAITVVLMFGGVLAVYSSRNIQSRTQIFTSILSILTGLVVTTLVIDLQRSTPLALLWPKALFATANAVVSPLITFAIILILEKVFNVATDLRLEEFDDINHPLLKQLNQRAPGTYQHTMNVVRLSEAAAADIGANQMLARVGALFHDIGKIQKSEYFVENQLDIDNKHDKLAPKKSASIIRQHIQDGIELAKEYGLPERVWKFIPTHHGTILIKHFYANAVDEALLKELAIDEMDFRYHGPKPDSKETGIVMLADAAEALSRIVDTSQRDDIESAVEAIIVDRVLDGQLSDTPLTLHDLDLIKESLVNNILGSSHKRVQYKQIPTQPPAAQK
ncbi:MAG: HDIG domain-containing protein [Ignavibacteria bacterium]|nr:HDIG domain-containing protein [Ignavibacteria bacterium]